MNWGRGLTIFIVLFILIMLGMVYVSFRQTNEMMEDNYYDRELKYQQTIDAKDRLHPYLSQLKVYDSLQQITIQLPQAISTSIESGNIEFIRMDNQSLDRKYSIQSTQTFLEKKLFQLGLYRFKIHWKNEGVDYFYENDIQINH